MKVEENLKARQLQKVIRFWEAKLLQRYLLSESTATLIELTIKYLKELDDIKERQSE